MSNSGGIASTGIGTSAVGIKLLSGLVTNAASAVITGDNRGVYIYGGAGTVTDGGSIMESSGTAVALDAGFANLVVINPGAVFGGTVKGGGTLATLELASSASGGTLTGLGSKYAEFGQITVGVFASWMLDGTNTVSSGQTLTELSGASLIDTGALVNNGGIVLDPSTMTVAGLTGTGSVTIDAGSTLNVQGTIASGETLAFAGSGACLHLGSRVNCRNHPEQKNVWPVRVGAAAFGENVPHRNLWLSPDHAVFVDDVLIPIKRLINGTTIQQVPMDEVTYYHIELPQHDVLLAEGLPAESYLDTGDRCNFENGRRPIALHPEFSARRRGIAHIWEALGCARLIVTGPELETVRQRVNLRVASLDQQDALTQRFA